MSGFASPTDDASAVTELLAIAASLVRELLILGMLGFWTVMWIALTRATLNNQGILEGVIIAVYAFAPVVFVLGWRVQALTGINVPTLGDYLGADEDASPESADAGAVADRYTASEQ